MLTRLPAFATACAQAGRPLDLVDLGTAFLKAVNARPGLADELEAEEESLGAEMLLGDLGRIASRAVEMTLQRPLDPPAVCRQLCNAGSLAAFTSFSALTNGLADAAAIPMVLAFPGDGDDHSFSLLNLRPDVDYRIPRL